MNLSYSVVIRTLGNTGEKYQALLQSIASQTIQPEEIIVVIPYGYVLDYRLGNERIVYSNKGMVTQRAVGIREAKSEYILVVDDDIQFAPTMVEELFAFSAKHNLDCCLPMAGTSDNSQQDTINLSYPLLKRIRGAITGQMFTSRRKSKYLDVITTTAGHKVYLRSNKLDECYLCETACFQCFFIKTQWAQYRHFEEAEYLQEGRLTSYAGYDDPTFFYPLAIKGMRMAYALRTRYCHLDASIGHKTKTKEEEKRIRYYSLCRNRTMFWYFSLWKNSWSLPRRIHVLLGGFYAFFNYTLYSIAVNIHPKNWKAIHCLFLGYYDAIKSIKYNCIATSKPCLGKRV